MITGVDAQPHSREESPDVQRLFIRHSHTPATVRGELGTRVPGLGPQSRRSPASTPKLTFQVEPEVIAHTRNACERGAAARAQWQLAFDSWAAANPQRKALYDRVTARELRTMSPMASAVQARTSIASAVQILSSTASWILSEDFATSSANSVRRGEGTRCPTPTGHRLCSTAHGECRRVEPGQRNPSIRRLVRVCASRHVRCRASSPPGT
jgi:hypothetical protein